MPTFLVTGASSGIGLELCRQLLARGDAVVATCRQRASSMSKTDALSDLESRHGALLTVLEGIDVARDDVGEKLTAALEAKAVSRLDVVIHNAGSVGGGEIARDPGASNMGDQAFSNVTMDKMRAAFEVNTLGPLRVQQAITPLMKGGKVAIVSTGFASISDNGSGGTYAYRTSKAAVNMVGKCMAIDLRKEAEIAVALVAPGFVATEFGPGLDKMTEMGAKPVDQAGRGILRCVDELTLENAGKFWMVRTSDGELAEMGW